MSHQSDACIDARPTKFPSIAHKIPEQKHKNANSPHVEKITRRKNSILYTRHLPPITHHTKSKQLTFLKTTYSDNTMNRTRTLNMATSYFRSAVNRSLGESTSCKTAVRQGDSHRQVGSLSCHMAHPFKNSAAPMGSPSSVGDLPSFEPSHFQAGWQPLGFST